MKNIMKAASLFAAITIGLALPVACEKPEQKVEQKEYILEIFRKDGFNFSFKAGSQRSTVTSNAPSLKAKSNYSWFMGEVLDTSSDGLVLEVTVEENTSGAMRKGDLELVALDENGNETKKISIPIVQNTNSGTIDGQLLFEDEIFEMAMVSSFDRDGNGAISEEEALAVKELDLESMGITSISGIEYFKNLEVLDVKDNKIKSIDVSGLDKLKFVYFDMNKVSSFKCEGCKVLQAVTGRSNQLTTIDLQPAQKSLQMLDLMQNKLTSLDLSGMDILLYAALGRNEMSSLKVDGCKKLSIFTCQNNKLTEIDIKDLVELNTFDISNNFLKSLNVSNSPDLGMLNISGNNRIENLDFSACTMIELNISGTSISNLNLSKNPDLNILRFSQTKITSVDLSNEKELKTLECSGLNLNGLDVKANTKLATLIAENSKLSSIDLSGKTALTVVNLGKNSIKTLDLGDSENLTEVKVKDNQMTSLVLAKALENSSTLKVEKDTDCVVSYR